MLAQEIIRRKRDGHTLSKAELEFMANGIADGRVSEGQTAAFAMAVFFSGMKTAETAEWTAAMTNSGSYMQWQRDEFDGPLLDKHSTGGVGDKVSLVLAPMLAACGAYVPMISGRGLAHTGGTLDKLEAIPGFQTQLDDKRFEQVVKQAGCAIVSANKNLAPADRKLYAVRDVTATVDSLPLITASILSKKLAANLDALVLDVKTGSGAFASSPDAATELAQSLVNVANQTGLKTTALITDMNQVLGHAAGNALEILECIEFLSGPKRDPRLESIVIALGTEALRLGGLANDNDSAQAKLKDTLDSGYAAERFQSMVAAQGGPINLLETPFAVLPKANVIKPVLSKTTGYLQSIDTRALGMAIITLGGGRSHPADIINPAVGVSEVAGIGEEVANDKPLAIVHAANEQDADNVANVLRQAMVVTSNPVKTNKLVVKHVSSTHQYEPNLDIS